MHGPKPLQIHAFGSPQDPLGLLEQTRQVRYVRGYLADLGATAIIEEPQYFDRDYLSEFSAFYGISTTGYPNVCRRLHFFAGGPLTRAELETALGHSEAPPALQDRYLGFVVLRPIPRAPFGRTVLRWYPDHSPDTPRVVEPSRRYESHLAGLRLAVTGLAWQQQDSGVGACATVGLWTMMHSSAFDDNHAIPTTADITRSAHEKASLGDRVFPSRGLTLYQIAEAIKAWNLSPMIIEGDLPLGYDSGFSAARFSATCAAFLRSGYPILLLGSLDASGGHAICAVGFRASGNPTAIQVDDAELQDSWITNVYVHDDNIGPNVKLKRVVGPKGEAVLELDAPAPTSARNALKLVPVAYQAFTPHRVVVAVHNDLRTSAEALHRAALSNADLIVRAANALLKRMKNRPIGATVSARFIRLSLYLQQELHRLLGGNAALLAKVRLGLMEDVRPMSLHLGVVRIGDAASAPMMDILFDTTDSDENHPVFANIAFAQIARQAEHLITSTLTTLDLGKAVDAF